MLRLHGKIIGSVDLIYTCLEKLKSVVIGFDTEIRTFQSQELILKKGLTGTNESL